MLRARLATLTLAGGLMLSSAGCLNLSERFHCWRANGGFRQNNASATPECPCEESGIPYGAIPTGLSAVEGGAPVLITPGAPGTPGAPTMTQPFVPPPPGQNVPIGPPPRIAPIPATAVPWQGQ